MNMLANYLPDEDVSLLLPTLPPVHREANGREGKMKEGVN
jgi:hypothetical protein